MSRDWVDDFSVWTGVAVTGSKAIILMGDDKLSAEKIPHTNVVHWDGRIDDIRTLEWSAVSACYATQPLKEVIVVGLEGEILAGPYGAMQEEDPIDIESSSGGKVGHLRAVRTVAGRAYVVGMDRQVYRREAPNSWVPLDDNLPASKNQVVGFEAVTGFSGNEIYAMGWKGEIWRFNGASWEAVSSPTNLILMATTTVNDTVVYAAGQGGVLLKGRLGSWDVIEHKKTQQYIWSLISFKDKLYMATRELLFYCSDDQFDVVEFGEDIPFSFYHLSEARGRLWSFGQKDVMTFDGDQWTRIL